jgi:hypothetical protein
MNYKVNKVDCDDNGDETWQYSVEISVNNKAVWTDYFMNKPTNEQLNNLSKYLISENLI